MMDESSAEWWQLMGLLFGGRSGLASNLIDLFSAYVQVINSSDRESEDQHGNSY